MYDEIDLEDIECRLYSQVYHSNIENEEINTPQLNITSQAHGKIHNSNRYFSGGYISGQPVFIPLEEENNTNSGKDSPSVHNSISFSPNSTDITTEGSFGKQFQNNITVNQYTLPLIINPELSEVLSPRGALFVPWSVENKKLLDKKNRKQQRRLENRRRRNQEKRTQNAVEYNSCLRVNAQKNKPSHVVFISDDSDNECVIVTEMCKNNLKAKEKTQVTTTSENLESETDDDIIYIPPPPIEVINVDIDNDNTESIPEVVEIVAVTNTENAITSTDPILSPNKSNCEPSGPTELSHTSESCTFNDFLDNSGVENDTSRFNFSLHGSDFNNTGDFVRPANPVDYCETESSCSTNDFNKETNSVKTIVFNEIDFPKEDIFSDKNLEGFSTYITPKRNISKESKIGKKSKSATRTCNESDTSSSSSESDYESSSNVNINIREGDVESYKKLPTLSPMQCERTPSKKLCKRSSTKSQCGKLQATSSAKKDSDKRKSSALENTESPSDTNDESKLATRKLPKKRKKSLSKKGNSSDEPSVDNINIELDREVTKDVGNSNSGESADTSIHEKRVKKKMKNSVEKVLDNNEVNAKENNDEVSDHIDDVNREDALESINNDAESINTDNANTTRKKKKKNSSSCKKSEIVNSAASNSSETSLEKVKRKKKKSVSSENSGSDIIKELNRSWVKINDSIIQYEMNKSNFTSNDEKGVSYSEVEPPEFEKSVPHTSHVENKTDTDKAKLPHEVLNIGEGLVEHVNKTSSLDPISLGVPEIQERHEEIIILDEVDSQNSDINEDCIEIVESSDSEYDFKQLEDVGHDLELANCSVNMATRKEFIDIGDMECYTNIKNTNLCEDYNKFDVEQIQNSQSDDPEIWKILPRDQLLYLNPNNNKGPRCNRCRHFGHIAVRCTEKPDPPKCTLCGFSDHQEPRCPNKRCTQCGNEGDYSTIYCWKCVKFRNSICRICDMKGHIAKTCPDLWRRYHLTTEEGPVVVLEDPQLKPRDQLWCSGCAEQGHLEHECNYYNREYPPTNPSIISYEDVLHQEDRDKFRNRTPSPPPPPVWNIPPQNNFYRPMSSYSNLPSTSQNIPFTTPIFIPQLPNLNQIFPGPNMLSQNEMMIPNNDINCDPNFAPVSTKVINPFSVLVRQKKNTSHDQILDQMMWDYVNDRNNITYSGCFDSDKGKVLHPHLIKHAANELMKNDQRRVKHTFMSMPPNIVKQFLRTELDELENVVSRSNPKYLKKKLFKCDRLPSSRKALNCNVVKEKCFWYRILNMFIFGVHHFNDGKLHINYIKKYLSEPKHNKFDSHKRKSLLNAYNYIFDASRHANVNYYKIMQQLIDRSSDGN